MCANIMDKEECDKQTTVYQYAGGVFSHKKNNSRYDTLDSDKSSLAANFTCLIQIMRQKTKSNNDK